MSSGRWEAAAALFDRALQQPDADRDTFLELACRDDPELLKRVRAMLEADARPSALLDATPDDLAAAVGADPVVAPLEGRRVGPYTILEVIGRGGMGIVCLAEREDVGMRVALKLVAGGLAAPDRVARFFRERRVLAQLEHPHIARLLDAGLTDDGTPWLAMEYVPGQAIDAYCDGRRLSIDERLALFERVADAVAYAHRHLIVHRDLKPSNVLVGAGGEPRLVDFGIAKPLSEALGEDSPLTESGLRLLTPEYASPEQLRGDPITTASDVFQLGALLFELLTGRGLHPARLGNDALLVPKPSRATTTAEIARARGVTPERLARLLEGDLDNVVLKATELDPDQRYATAQQLADDVRRHRQGLPVLARPGAPWYRVRKFVGRHKAGTATATAALLALLGFALMMERQSRRVAAQYQRAEQVSTLLADLFAGADPVVAQGDTITVVSLLDRGANRIEADASIDPEVRARLLTVMAGAYENLGRHARRLDLLGEAVETMRQVLPRDHQTRLWTEAALTEALVEAGRIDDARELADQTLAAARRLPASRRRDLAMALSAAGFVRIGGDADAARRLHLEALDIFRSIADSSDPAEATLVNLGYLAQRGGDDSSAIRYWTEALERRRARVGSEHSVTAKTMIDLVNGLLRLGRLDDAERMVSEAVAIQRRVFAGPHVEVVTSLMVAAKVLAARGKLAEAEAASREALAMNRSLGVEGGAEIIANLAGYVERQGRADEAAELHREAIAGYTAMLGPRHVNTAIAMTNLGFNALFLRRRPAEAESLYRLAMPVLDSAWRNTGQIAGTLMNFGFVLAGRDKCAEAEPAFRRALSLARQSAETASANFLGSQRGLGACLGRLGRVREAESLLVDTYQRLRDGLGPANTFTRLTASDLATLYQRMGKPRKPLAIGRSPTGSSLGRCGAGAANTPKGRPGNRWGWRPPG